MEDIQFEFMKEHQTCKDREVTEKFTKLHEELVNRIIEFSKENNLPCDAFSLYIDGIQGSIPFGQWTCATDSSCRFKVHPNDRDNYLYEI